MTKLEFKDVLEEKHMTLKELSEKTDISIVELSFIKKGKKKPRLPNVHKIADALGLTYEETFDMFYL